MGARAASSRSSTDGPLVVRGWPNRCTLPGCASCAGSTCAGCGGTQSRFHGFQIVEISLNSKTLRGAQTSESLGTAPVRWEVVEIRAPLPAESAHPDVRHGTPSWKFPTVVVEQVQPAPVVECGTLASAVTSPVVEYVTPARTVACAAPVTTITSGGNSVSNCDSAIHRANCAEARGDSTGPDLGQNC